MEKKAPNQKTKKKPSQPKPDGFKPKAKKKEEEAPNQQTKKILHTLNSTGLNQNQ